MQGRAIPVAQLGVSTADGWPTPRPARLRILGVRVDAIDEQRFLAAVAGWAAERTPRQIVTINPEFVMTAQVDRAFASVLEQADLAVPDGVGILWAARRQGVRLRQRVGGADVVLPLARQCAALGQRLFLLGAAGGVAEQAAHELCRLAPGLQIAGAFAGSPRPEHDAALVARVRAAEPQVLLVAYGAPAQDMWIGRNKERLGVPVSMGVGGTLDYLAGVQRRAPAIVRRLWLDWAFRLITQPWRWRRMLALPRFAWAVLREGKE